MRGIGLERVTPEQRAAFGVEVGIGGAAAGKQVVELALHVDRALPGERAALDGEHTLEDLHGEFGAEKVDDTISQMQELEVIEDAADDDLIAPEERTRFDRQLRYFSDIGGGKLVPSECQRRLREAKVAVLGVGGLGGWTAWSLATCGIGEMWLVDGDRVSSLNRLCAHSVDGRVISYRLAHFLRFRDGKIIENLSLIDSFDAVEQVLGHPLAVHEAPALAAETGELVAL